jgi:hypothetical protein
MIPVEYQCVKRFVAFADAIAVITVDAAAGADKPDMGLEPSAPGAPPAPVLRKHKHD